MLVKLSMKGSITSHNWHQIHYFLVRQMLLEDRQHHYTVEVITKTILKNIFSIGQFMKYPKMAPKWCEFLTIRFRQIICDALRTSGIDISGLSDPLGASDLEIKDFPDMSGNGKLSSDVSADDISLKFPFGNTSNSRDFSQLTQKDKAFSFTDLLTPYKAVPQVNLKPGHPGERILNLEFLVLSPNSKNTDILFEDPRRIE